MAASTSASSSFPAAPSSTAAADSSLHLTKQIRSREVTIAELNNLQSSRMNSGKARNGNIRCRKFQTIACSNRKEKSCVASLPEEIVFFILVRLPADILYNSAQYVCWQWYSIIRNPCFIYEHLLRSTTSGLFIQYDRLPYTPCFAELGKRNATVTEVSFPFPIEVLATCDGLVLFRDRQNRDGPVLFSNRKNMTIRVANPLIKKVATVPPLTVQGYHYSYFSLVRARSTREYKVVFAYGSNLRIEDFDCMVVTLGKDHAWKLIKNKFPNSCRKLFCCRALSKGGFLYWAHFDFPFVVTLDVESEMFYEFPIPAALCEGRYTVPYYLTRGKSLSCMVQFLGSPGIMFWDVWDLCDPMSGEWKKLYRIEWDFKNSRPRQVFKGLPSRSAVMSDILPIAWVNNGEVVLFCVSCSPGPYVAYNVKTGETFTFGSHTSYVWWYFWRDYAYSLVWLTLSSLITRGGGGS
ncbi:F-box protein At3g08750-like isoform X2 [Actinidia eriantha]|uniref:F-box protein At3g08750-like isoform X2 n=1 Tax=Actinidia eriantha TaxID=165200 RepID=UPI002586ACA4|nr:F-box protein At3g08750-like isoform X2 [Actinidia eriantha]